MTAPTQAETAKGRVPPHDLRAEEAVLAAVLLDGDALDAVIDLLQPEHFYWTPNGWIFEGAVALAAAGKVADTVTVARWLSDRDRLVSAGGPAYLAQLVDATPAVANVRAHAEIVRDKWMSRRVIATCHAIAAAGYTAPDGAGLLDQAEQSLFALAEGRSESTTQHVSALLRTAFQKVEAAAESGDPVTGLRTGLRQLDLWTTGLHAGDVIIVAARPGLGKTSFALGVGLSVAKSGAGVAVFSQEMPGEQLATRTLAHEARVDLLKLRQGRLDANEWRELAGAASRVAQLPLWIDEAPALRLLELRSKVRRLRAQRRKPVELVIVDYLQLMVGDGGNREQESSGITRGLKTLAKELKVPVIALSQLNRAVEGRADKRPQLSDLRESGGIEQDADAVLFLYRDDYYNPDSPDREIAEVHVAKQRNGPTGTFRVRFDAACTRFDNLAEVEP